MPEHLMQTKIPRFTLAQRGPTSLVSIYQSVVRDRQTEREGEKESARESERDAGACTTKYVKCQHLHMGRKRRIESVDSRQGEQDS
jgi:hypothetical protein